MRLNDLFCAICVTLGRQFASPCSSMQFLLQQEEIRPGAKSLLQRAGNGVSGRIARVLRPVVPAILFSFLLASSPRLRAGQAEGSSQPNPPDAPQPQTAAPQTANPCEVKNAGGSMAATAAMRALQVSSAGSSQAPGPGVVSIVLCVPHLPVINWYARFLNGPQVKPLTPLEKAHLAGRNLVDPFNLLTVTGEAAISVAANSHSPYGPGFHGYGRYVGVSFTQDLTGEFFGTFLIPSLAHQDPHYHRMPAASLKRRIAHAAYQVFWTQGDNGRGMVNYADLVGFAINDEIGNFYVPGQQTRLTASAGRYGIGLATAPIDNYITEFLPDVARHIHVQIVIVQRIINQVARTGAGEP